MERKSNFWKKYKKRKIGKVLKMWRVKEGKSVREIANELGISEWAVYAWERGRSYPPSWALLYLCLKYPSLFQLFKNELA